ncbi:Ankyrin repeat protein [Pandoravirus kuranda]|uniref:Ankyrin repeat protein n=1 Tax=Pandoravirus kuranda TaxID=3019033 RepID=A0AA95EJ61_9VIRU|nr:Ankyrin repeat protein [Pandoravirus kuranda]
MMDARPLAGDLIEGYEHTSSMSALPTEIQCAILLCCGDAVDRAAAYCVCALWRRILRENRRYAWACSRRDIFHLVALALDTDRPRVAEWLATLVDPSLFRGYKLLESAVHAGNERLYQTLRKCGIKWQPSGIPHALAGNHEALNAVALHDALADGALHNAAALLAVVEKDLADIVSAVWSPDCAWLHRKRLIVHAAAHGAVSVLRWLRAVDSTWLTPATCERLAQSPHDCVFDWLVGEVGASPVREWYDRARVECNARALARLYSYEGASLEPHRRPRLVAKMLLASAAQSNHYDIVRLAIDIDPGVKLGCGDDVVEWRGLDPDHICDEHTHLDVVRTLMERGVGISTFAYGRAAERGHIAVLDHLWQHRVPFPSYHYAWILSGHVSVVRWALDHGVPLGGASLSTAVLARARDGLYPGDSWMTVVRLLLEHGYVWSERACLAAASTAMLDILAMAIDNVGTSWDPRECLCAALATDSPRHRATAEWIAERAGIRLAAFERDLIQQDDHEVARRTADTALQEHAKIASA